MKQTAFISASIAAATLAASCVTTPPSHTAVDITAPLVFSGVYPGARRDVSIQMWGWDGSTWVPLGAPVTVGTDGRWTTGSLTVPVAYWEGPCRAARFRATGPGGAVVPTLNQACIEALGPSPSPADTVTCLSKEVVLYGVSDLASYAPPGGTLNIASQQDADRYQCVSELAGNLSLNGGSEPAGPGVFRPGRELVLRHLARVTGNLDVSGNHAQRIALPRLTSVQGDVTLRQNVFRLSSPAGMLVNSLIELPALTSVGTATSGTLSLLSMNIDSATTGSAQWPHEFGLDTITSAHSIVASNEGHISPNRVEGLSGLTEVSGDVTIASPRWELYGSGLLSNLARIRGALIVTTGNQLNGALPSLTHVDGNVSIVGTGGCAVNSSTSSSNILPQLAEVGGDLTIQHCRGWACDRRVFPALHTVTGTLRFTDGVNGFTSLEMGAGALSVGALTIDGTTVEGIFRHDVLSVQTGGTIRIVDNSSLCECRVDALLTRLQEAGWTGTVDRARNSACSPCTAEPVCASAPR